MSEAKQKHELSADELVLALQICNHRKGERCSSCPAFGKFGYPRACKRTVDLKVAKLYKRLKTENAELHTQEQNERNDQYENTKLLSESDIRDMAGEVVVVIRTTEAGKTVVSKVVVDLFDHQDDHCLICWKLNIRGANIGLNPMEKNCVLLPFSELGYTWCAYDYTSGIVKAASKLRAQEQNEPLTCDGCMHEHCDDEKIRNYCWICKRSHPYSDRYEPKGGQPE